MFGNGIGFVWHPSDAQQEDVVKGALIHEVKAGFVAVKEGQLGGGGLLTEGGGDANDIITRGLGG